MCVRFFFVASDSQRTMKSEAEIHKSAGIRNMFLSIVRKMKVNASNFAKFV